MEYKNIKIEWLGHASFKLKNSKVIYIDPFELSDGEKADIILVTHTHYDHCSLRDIEKIIKDNTLVIGPVDAQSKLGKLGNVKFRWLQPGQTIETDSIRVTGYPAYNINKHFHPKSNDWLGYLIEVNGIRVYHAGDTDAIPELKGLSNIDILLLPVGGTYTMNAEEAANIANAIKPAIAIPMHYGSIVGTENDAERFKRLTKMKVEILRH